MLAVLAAPDAATMREPIASGGTGTLVLSRGRGRMVFTSSGLPELPESSGYELWLTGPGGTRSAGMLERAGGGLTEPVLAATVRADEQVALTVEPAAGSKQPTTEPILLADLTGVSGGRGTG
jgi:anti-sigma-K factor RskA